MKHNYQYDLIIVSENKKNLINRITNKKAEGEIMSCKKVDGQMQVTVKEKQHAFILAPGYINGIEQVELDYSLAYFGITIKNQLRLYRITEQPATFKPESYYSWGKDKIGRIYVYLKPGDKRTYPGNNNFERLNNDNADNQGLWISHTIENPDNIDETWEYWRIADNPVKYDDDFRVEGVTEEGYLCLYKRSKEGWRMWEYGSYSSDEYDRIFFTEPFKSERIYPKHAFIDGRYLEHPTKGNLKIKTMTDKDWYLKWWHEKDERTKVMDTKTEKDTMEQKEEKKEISRKLYDKLEMLGIIDSSQVRTANEGNSDYAAHTIQPWSIWLDYKDLTPWDADIIKRILRTKDDKSMTPEQQRTMDYNKIIHICQERIRQIQLKENQNKDKIKC